MTIEAVQLPLLHHMHGLDAGNQSLRTPERFEAQHWIGDSLFCSVTLLDDVVEIFRRGCSEFCVNGASVNSSASFPQIEW